MLPAARTTLEHALETQAHAKHHIDPRLEDEVEKTEAMTNRDLDAAATAVLEADRVEKENKQLSAHESEALKSMAFYAQWHKISSESGDQGPVLIETTNSVVETKQ